VVVRVGDAGEVSLGGEERVVESKGGEGRKDDDVEKEQEDLLVTVKEGEEEEVKTEEKPVEVLPILPVPARKKASPRTMTKPTPVAAAAAGGANGLGGHAHHAEQPTKSAAEYKEEGNAYMAMGASGKAVKAYGLGLEVEPENIVLLTNRAAARFNLGLYEQSVQDAQKAIDLDPKWWKAYKRKALALFSMDRFDDSLACLEEAIKLFPDNDELKNNLAELNKLLERMSMLYILPSSKLLSKLDGIPVFLVADATGQPFFITYEDGQQICTFYFEYEEAKSTLEWIRNETPDLGKTARIVPVSLSQALKLTQETNEQILREEDAKQKERASKETQEEADMHKDQALMFNFRADAKALEDAVFLLKNPPPPPPQQSEGETTAEAVEGEKKQPGSQPTGTPDLPVNYDNLTVENFNGIPVFQAKGLTLLQNNQQYIPLFFTKPDLEFAWDMLKQNGSFGVEEAPEQCEIDIGTLEDVLRRMAETEKNGEFNKVVFVASKEARKHVGPEFPVDEVTKSTLDAHAENMNKNFLAAKQIAAAGGSKEAIREAIRAELARKLARDARYASVVAKLNLGNSKEENKENGA